MIDRLFDRRSISFENLSGLLISLVAHGDSMKKIGIITNHAANSGGLAESRTEFPRLGRAESTCVLAAPRGSNSAAGVRHH
jgi:hypothetical protein